MVANVGRDILLYWGADSPPEPIAGVRQKDLSIAGEAIDITSDDDAGWRALLSVPGQKHVEIKVSGVTKNSLLMADWFAGTTTQLLSFEYPNGDTLSGNFYLSEYSEKVGYKDAVTFDASFMSTGVVTFTPSVGP
jgi:predicted secreted protein